MISGWSVFAVPRTLALAVVCCWGVAQSCSAALVYEANFDTGGDTEGWVDFSDRIPGDVVAGGVWAGTGGANNDPQFRTSAGTLDIDVAAFSSVTLEIRAKTSDGSDMNGGVSFVEFVGATASNTAGLPTVNFTLAPAAADTFEVFTVDVKAIVEGIPGGPTSGGTNDFHLRSIRFDPLNNIGGVPILGKTFEIDYFRITAVPEPTSLLMLSGVACLLAAKGRRRVAS